MSNLQTFVIAHGAKEAIFRRHLALWKRHSQHLTLICPKDDPIQFEPRLELSASQGAGDSAHIRLASLIDHASTLRNNYFAFFEYDSFYIDPVLPMAKGFFANIFPDAESPRFISHRYPGFPWVIDRESLLAMHAKSHQYPAMIEHGHNDRWLGALASLSGVPMMDFRPKGFSVGNIDETNFNDLKRAIENGARAIHGVKDKWVFDYITEKTCLSQIGQ